MSSFLIIVFNITCFVWSGRYRVSTVSDTSLVLPVIPVLKVTQLYPDDALSDMLLMTVHMLRWRHTEQFCLSMLRYLGLLLALLIKTYDGDIPIII